MEDILARSGQGSNGPPMEGVNQGNNGMTALPILVMGIFTSRLNGAFIRFSPRIREEDFLHASLLTNFLGQFYLRLGVVEVGYVVKLMNLVCNSLSPNIIIYPKGGNPNARAQIDVVLARLIL